MSRDTEWLVICNAFSQRSKCLSRQVGAIIVKDNKYLISAGYNGPVVGAGHCSDRKYRARLVNLYEKDGGTYHRDGTMAVVEVCPRRPLGFQSGQGIEYCQAAHGERNAICMAARFGHSTEGCTMYMNCGIPCLECAKSIVNAGIKEIVVTDKNLIYEKKGLTGLDILLFGGVKIREYDEKE